MRSLRSSNKCCTGCIIVSKRRCVYSNIDPKVSRQLFIRSALVEQDLGQNEGFLQFNRELIEDIQTLENKSRRRDILVDEQTLYEFYDRKIPAQINSRAAFLTNGTKHKSSRINSICT